MNSVLDFMGAMIYFVLNIVLFPLFILVHGLLMIWSFEKFAALQVKKYMLRFKNGSFQFQERRSLAFIRKTMRMSH